MSAVHWAKACSLVRSSHYGRKLVFNGPQCHKLLENLDKLDGLLIANGLLGRCKQIRECFRAFKNVTKSCFGNVLFPRYQNDIREFAGTFFNLIDYCDEISTPQNNIKLNVTLKVHIVFLHIIQFIETRKSDQNVEFGLGFDSEQR